MRLKQVVRILMGLLTAVLVAGCDGHFHTIYLREPTDVKPPWHVGTSTISISGSEDITTIVADVAKALGMVEGRGNTNSYSLNLPNGFSFYMSVKRSKEGFWAVSLVDWPTFVRSEVSRRAEEKIKMRLQSKLGSGSN